MPTDPGRARGRTSSVAKRSSSSSEFAVRVLRAAADLHRASRDAERWPAAYTAFRSLVGCTGSLPGAPAQIDDPEEFIAECFAWIVQCRRPGARGCWSDHDDPQMQESLCLLLVEHLEIALDNALIGRQQARKISATAALDAFDRPLIVFDGQHRLVHANHAGHAELAARRWIAVIEEYLLIGPLWIENQFADCVAALSGEKPANSAHMQIRLPDDEVLEIRLRRALRSEDSPAIFLLSQSTVATAIGSSSKASSNDFNRLENATARQRELARILLAGATLTDAAARMGISRATANGHLKKLFDLSNTTRQTELIAWLTRTIHF